jgi:hypothetical protein
MLLFCTVTDTIIAELYCALFHIRRDDVSMLIDACPLVFAAGVQCKLRFSGMSRVESRKLSNVSANIAVSIFRVNMYWLEPARAIALMMEVESISETSVNFYETTRRNIPEDNHLLLLWQVCIITNLCRDIEIDGYYKYTYATEGKRARTHTHRFVLCISLYFSFGICV